MFNIVLVNPEIPPNTGNIIRLASNIGSRLHLVEPLGFELSHRQLRRAGLDYHQYAWVCCHCDIEKAYDACGSIPSRRFAISCDGNVRYDTIAYEVGDTFVFGCESVGLSHAIKARYDSDCQLYIPMQPNNRSFNLSNSVAIVLMEAWRQKNFSGALRTN